MRLLFLLRQSEGLSLSQIALSLECSHRTAVGDLELLRASGFEVAWTSGGYRIVAPPKSSRTTVEPERLLTLLESIDATPFLRSLPARRQLRHTGSALSTE